MEADPWAWWFTKTFSRWQLFTGNDTNKNRIRRGQGSFIPEGFVLVTQLQDTSTHSDPSVDGLHIVDAQPTHARSRLSGENKKSTTIGHPRPNQWYICATKEETRRSSTGQSRRCRNWMGIRNEFPEERSCASFEEDTMAHTIRRWGRTTIPDDSSIHN